MFKKLRQIIESNRGKNSLFWKILIRWKDFMYNFIRLQKEIKSRFKIHRIDRRKIPKNKKEIRLFMVVILVKV